MWLVDQGCGDIVKKAWEVRPRGQLMYRIVTKIKKCKRLLHCWSKDHFGSVKNQIRKKEELLWKAEEASANGGDHNVVVQLRCELNVLLDKENHMWFQRSRALWLAEGDRNTRFFHRVATQRKRKNFIKGIRDRHGAWLMDEKAVGGIFVDFYTRLFTSSNPTELERVLAGVQPVVDDFMNEALLQPFVREEVEVAIKQMAPLKASGPDGMPHIFYKHFWPDIGMEISDVVLSCLNSGTFLRSIYHTFITLIPKVDNPKIVAQFRPISLCNVIYKILSKVLVNRLKPILNSIISEA